MAYGVRIFLKLVDKRVSGCSQVVVVLRVKIGPFSCCYVTPPPLLFAVVLLATLRLFRALAQFYQEHYEFKIKRLSLTERLTIWYIMLVKLVPA